MAPLAPSPEELDRRRDMERLFGESGWHILVKEWQERLDRTKANALETIRDEKDLWRQRGWVDILEYVLRAQADFESEKAAADAPAEVLAPDYE